MDNDTIKCNECNGIGLCKRKGTFKCHNCKNSKYKNCYLCENANKGIYIECNKCFGTGQINILDSLVRNSIQNLNMNKFKITTL
mgnify:FL=1|tara:strand:+ start:13458 stop:13709 length:252 start_codon:yes stop_codon:yes gene_type:complete